MRASAAALETISVKVPEAALETFEAALGSVCATVGFFRDQASAWWRVEGVKPVGEGDAALTAALVLAAALTGVEVTLRRAGIPADGWLARTRAAFPQQVIGRRLAVRGTHLSGPKLSGRITLTLDAGLAFGSGEHGSTRGCLRALERVAHRRPRRILDLGTGSGILAMAAARLLHRRVLATDLDPWSVRVARQNAVLNRIGPMLRCRRADGWRDRAVRAGGPYDLVLANILARPLCLMARPLAAHLATGGTAIVAGLLANQARQVLVAHRRQGMRLVAIIAEGPWTTLVLRAGPFSPPPPNLGPLRGPSPQVEGEKLSNVPALLTARP
jgi:ribosomal protein L11 methyltransferase